MQVPYLIQRAQINRRLNEFKGERLSKSIDCDYMGSAEFEFGAIPKAYRAIRDDFLNYRQSKIEAIMENDAVLRLFHNFNDEDLAKYTKYLLQMRGDQYALQTKENVGFDPNSYYYKRTDFWWDIENHVMWSFDKEFMKRLPQHLEVSFAIMQD